MIFADQHLGGGTCGNLPHTAHAHDDRHLAELSGDQIGAVPAAALDSMQGLDDGFSFLRQRTQHRNAMMSLHTPIVGHGCDIRRAADGRRRVDGVRYPAVVRRGSRTTGR